MSEEEDLEQELEEATEVETEDGGLMSPDDIRRRETIRQFAENVTKQLSDGISLDPLGVLRITREADAMGLKEAALYLNDSDLNCESMGTMMKLAIARIVLETAAREDKDEVEVIDELGLVERVGRSLSSLQHWIRAVRVLPEDSFRFGLTMYQYQALSAVPLPDKGVMPEFAAKRAHLVDRIAEDPNAFPHRLIDKEMRQILASVQPDKKDKDKPPKPEGLGTILRRMVDCYRVKEVANQDEGVLKEVGVSMPDLSSQLQSDESELINRNEIQAEVEKTILHFGGETIEVETEEVTEGEG